MATDKKDIENKIDISDNIDYKQKFSSLKIERKNMRNRELLIIPFIATITALFSSLLLLLDSEGSLFNFSNREIEILVVDQNGEPIEKAEIIYINDGSVSSKPTNSSGYTNVKNIKSPYKIVDILIKKEGFKPTIEEILLDDSSKKNKIFKLEK